MSRVCLLAIMVCGLTSVAFGQTKMRQGTDLPGSIRLKNATTTIVINGGIRENGLVPYGGLFRYHDHEHRFEETTWSVDPVLISRGTTYVLSRSDRDGFGKPVKLSPNLVQCKASLGKVDVEVDFELVGSNAKQTFRFDSQYDLTGSTFVYYAENDLFGHANDIASFTGSLPSRNLALYMYDSKAGGLSVKLTGIGVQDSKLSLFGAGIWTGWGLSLEKGKLTGLSYDGRNFKRYGDTGLALAFELSGKQPELIINYDSLARPPYDPKSLRFLENYDRSDDYYSDSRSSSDDEMSNRETADSSAAANSNETTPGSQTLNSLDQAIAFQNKTSWRLKTGKSMQARLVRINKSRKTFVLQTPRGRTISLPIDRFHSSELPMLRQKLEEASPD